MERTSFLEQTIARRATFRIVGCLAAIFGTLIFLWYFMLGLCSLSGGLPFPYSNVQLRNQATAARAESEYLIAHGAKQTGEQDADFWPALRRVGVPLATYAYPLHFGRVMRITVFPDRDAPERVQIAFDCRGITPMDMGKAQRLTERMRTDFLKQAFEIRQARTGEARATP